MNQNFHHKQNKTKPTNSILCKLDICAYQQTYIHTPTKLTKKNDNNLITMVNKKVEYIRYRFVFQSFFLAIKSAK